MTSADREVYLGTMKTRAEIAWRARKILQETAAACPQYADYLHYMMIEVSDRLTSCAGKAYYNQNLIKLSLPFYADDANFGNDLEDTMTHEAAHLIAYTQARSFMQRIKPHGPEWRSIHLALGGSGKRCHNLQLAEGFQARKRQPLTSMPCSKCGQSILLKPSHARSYAEGIRRGSMGPGTGFGFSHGVCPPDSLKQVDKQRNRR